MLARHPLKLGLRVLSARWTTNHYCGYLMGWPAVSRLLNQPCAVPELMPDPTEVRHAAGCRRLDRFQLHGSRIICDGQPDATSDRQILSRLGQGRHLAAGATGRRITGLSSAAIAGDIGTFQLPTTFKIAVTNYLRATNPARGIRAEYQTTLRKWHPWGRGVPSEKFGRKEIREFLD